MAQELKDGSFDPGDTGTGSGSLGAPGNLGLGECAAELSDARAWVEEKNAFLDRALATVWTLEQP